jgi:hypothetical protein
LKILKKDIKDKNLTSLIKLSENFENFEKRNKRQKSLIKLREKDKNIRTCVLI